MLLILVLTLCVNLLSGIESKIIKIGINFQEYSDESFIQSKFTPGLFIGVATTFNLSSKFKFQPELICHFSSISLDGDIELKIDNDEDGLIDEDEFDLLDNDGDGYIDEDRVDYFCNGDGNTNFVSIEIPLLLKYKVHSLNKQDFSFYTGASVDVILNGNFETEINNQKHNGDFTRANLGLNGIFGIDYTMDRVYLDFRFSGSIIKDKWKFETEESGYEDFREIFPKDYLDLEMKERIFSISLSLGLLI